MNRPMLRVALLALSLALALFASTAPSASAACPPHDGLPFGVSDGCFDVALNADAGGEASFTQAGGHPYSFSTQFQLNTDPDPINGSLWPSEPLKDAFVDLPPGLIGNPTVLARCSLDQLVGSQEVGSFSPQCPEASQVGVVTLSASAGPDLPVAIEQFLPGFFVDQPLYSMVAPPDVPARFAFKIPGATFVTLDAGVRSGGDYGLYSGSRDTSEALPLLGATVTLWGTPADPSHDAQRFCSGEGFSGPRCPAGVPPQAFLRLPTSCAGPQPWALHTDSWFNPGAVEVDGSPDLSDPNWKEASLLSHRTEAEGGEPVGASGCEEVPFEPSISVQPTSHRADSPSGLTVDLTIPQDELTNPDPAAIAQSDLKKAVVTLPEGMSVNPSSANGLGSCTAAQIDLHGANTEPKCPDSSKIGTVTLDTPLLEEQLQGSVYLAAQGDNPFNSLLALYIVARGPGTVVKLAGKVTPTESGQLVTTFDNQPQIPFSKLHLELFGGDRAPLRTPSTCGSHAITEQLSPWSGNAPVELQSAFQITSAPNGVPCVTSPEQRSFDPSFEAGTQNNAAGSFSPFALRVTRPDGSQELSGLGVKMPEGLTARLADVPYCPEVALGAAAAAGRLGTAELAAPSCPAASQIGTVATSAGAGALPFHVQGKAYLAGPYRGAPLSLAAIVPALAGPFDLGNVLVRTALNVDPETAQIHAFSDPLPLALQGISLDLRSVMVNVDKPNFTLNPTNCGSTSIDARIAGASGAVADRSARFQVADCAALGFKPKLALSLKGPTKRTGHPALRAVLKARGGEANIARAQVTLPHSEFLDQSHIGTVCTRVQFAAHACPPASVYGKAIAYTPLLDQPLSGPVYLRSSSNKLPDLVADLNGQIEVTLDGKIDTGKGGGIRNTFQVVPDAPVSKFTLEMQGGSKGLLVNSTNICKSTNRAISHFVGQNGKVSDTTPLISNDCKKGKGKRKGHRH